MLDQLFRRPRVRARIRANLLGDWIEAYVAYLDARGHPPGTIQQYVQAVEHFGVWLASEHIAIEDVTRATIDSFLHDHLPHCQCPTPAPTCLHQVRAALAHLPARPRRSLSPASARITTESRRCGPRALWQLPPGHLRPGRVHLHLSGSLRPRIPPAQVRRRAREMGDDPPRGSDGLHRGIRRPLSPRLGTGRGQFPAKPPAVPPAPGRVRTGPGGRRPSYPELATGSPPANDDRRTAPPVPGLLRPVDPDGPPRLRHGPLSGRSRPAGQRGERTPPRGRRLARGHPADRGRQVEADAGIAPDRRGRTSDRGVPPSAADPRPPAGTSSSAIPCRWGRPSGPS